MHTSKTLLGAVVAVLATAAAAGAAPAPSPAATTITLFPAHDTANGQAGPFDTTSVVMLCRPNDLTIIESLGSATGLIVDNFLTETVKRLDGTTVLSAQNLCGNGNGAAALGDSCFSSNNLSVYTPGTPANSAYQGIGTVAVPTVPGLAVYTFQLVNGPAPAVGPNPQASNALWLETFCQVRGGDARRGRAAAKK